MNELISQMDTQPAELHSFITKLVERKISGIDIASFPHLGNRELDWLTVNGFDYRYNSTIHEWEVKL